MARPTKLTAELIEEVGRLAGRGLPPVFIRSAVDVHASTWSRWLKAGEADDADDLHRQFRAAVIQAQTQLAVRLLDHLHAAAAGGDVKATIWMLTHHPAMREHFSERAAERRAVRETVGRVIAGIKAERLPLELEHRLWLQLEAHGVGLLSGEEEEEPARLD
jgi:hypothetical protein